MYYLNKVIAALANPTAIGFPVLIALLFTLWRTRMSKGSLWVGVVAVVFGLWLWATPLMTRMLGMALEREWLVEGRVPEVESFPKADVIVCLGGGMGVQTNVSPYAEMWASADRVWQAARLYKAGKSPKILLTSGGTDFSTGPLLADLGVPKDAVAYDFSPKNTEEEVAAVKRILGDKTRVLLVTSAWHMRRARLMFEKYAPELDVVPAPADFEATFRIAQAFSFTDLLPSGQVVALNELFFKEWLGYVGYKYLRR